MRIQTRGNSTTVWLSSDVGVIDGTMTMSAPTLEKILQAVNEKYGTSFEGWSQLPAVYEVGDTVPNWNAYEKIELPIDQKLAIGMNGNSVFSIGRLIGTEFYITVKSANQGYWTNNEGKITSLGGPTSEAGAEYIKGLLENKGYAISEIKDNIVQYEVGEIVEDWNSYEILMQ